MSLVAVSGSGTHVVTAAVAVVRCVGVAAADSLPTCRRESQATDCIAHDLPDDESWCQVAGFTLASQCLGLQARCSCQEYELAEKVGFRASVHRRLELLDAVHGAFDRSGVVLQGEAGDHRVQVASQPGGERAQCR